MGHYDWTVVMIHLGGVFSGEHRGIEQTTIKKLFEKEFNVSLNDKNICEKTQLNYSTIIELKAFINGNYVGVQTKGDVFCYAGISNYRHLEDMKNDWKLITKKLPDCFGNVFIMSACENGNYFDCAMIHNGEFFSTGNPWHNMGIFDKVN